MMDELRDYRYYATDMLHLSEAAINYIFERFQTALFSPESILFSKSIAKIKKSIQHRPFNSNSAEYKKFLEANILEIRKLTSNYPNISFREEITYFENELAKF